jgi:hypothetical protein
VLLDYLTVFGNNTRKHKHEQEINIKYQTPNQSVIVSIPDTVSFIFVAVDFVLLTFTYCVFQFHNTNVSVVSGGTR